MIDSSTTTIDRADPHEAVVDSCYQDLLLLANDSSALCNGSGLDVLNDTVDLEIDSVNGTRLDVDGLNNWWAMLALVLVLGTAAGNILVCLAIARERRLQNVTNYFLMSLAITDLLVAVLVMPLGILTLVRGKCCVRRVRRIIISGMEQLMLLRNTFLYYVLRDFIRWHRMNTEFGYKHLNNIKL